MSELSNSVWSTMSDLDYMRANGRGTHPSHTVLVDQLGEWYGDQPVSLLDCGVLSGVTYQSLAATELNVAYTGIDFSDRIVADCRTRFPAAQWQVMSVMDLAFADRSFDVVHCRHVLECLPYYETAVREAFRVARRHVVISMSVIPRDPEALLRREVTSGEGYLWLNRYAPGPFEGLLDRLAENVVSLDVGEALRANRIYLCTKSEKGTDRGRTH